MCQVYTANICARVTWTLEEGPLLLNITLDVAESCKDKIAVNSCSMKGGVTHLKEKKGLFLQLHEENPMLVDLECAMCNRALTVSYTGKA